MATVLANASHVRIKSRGPDPVLVKDQLNLLQYAFNEWGLEAFCRFFIWILTKQEDIKHRTRLVPLVFNPIQQNISQNIAQKNICLKPRQVGLTTWFQMARNFAPTTVTPGTNAFLISQNGEYVGKHFRMLRRAYKWFGAADPRDNSKNDLMFALQENLLHTSASNRKELIFDQLDSTIAVGSAEVEEVGQGVTLHRIVCSEVARWPGNPEETLANLKEALVLTGTLDMESTANGAEGNYFYQEYMRAEAGISEFKPHFHEWWWEPTYRVELSAAQQKEMQNDLTVDERRLMDKIKLTLQQIAFRRAKQIALRHNFDEKYPENAVDCFLTSGNIFFDKDILRYRMQELIGFKPMAQTLGGQCQIFKMPLPKREYIIGADPASGKQVGAEFGDDRDLDYSAAKVVDLMTGEEVAAYSNKLDPQSFGMDLAELGKFYNGAMIAVERSAGVESGGDGGTVLTTLIHDCFYGNIYKHVERFRKRKEAQGKRPPSVEGLPMNGAVRPMALNRLRYFIANYPDMVWDVKLIKECMAFVRDERGRPAAREGAHDDSVLAAAIAHYARAVVLGYIDPATRGRAEKYGSTPVEYAEEEEFET